MCGGLNSISFAVRNSNVPSEPPRTPLPGVRVSGNTNTGRPSAPMLLNVRTSVCTVPVSEKKTEPSNSML